MKDVGVDLGTANVVIFVKGKGIVLNEPSVVAIDNETKQILAVGKEANDMIGRTPDKITAIKPMKDGVIADFDMTDVMLNKFIKKAIGKFAFRPKILICCPSNITQVEKNAIREAANRTGASKVYIEEEPKAAAIGAGLDISKPTGNMIIDIGGGTTDIAILSLGNIVNSESIKIAGNTFDNDIISYIKNKYKLLIGDTTAELIKKELGTVIESKEKKSLEVKGRDIVSGLPKTITVNESDIIDALKDDVMKIILKAKAVLEKTLPELSADIIDKGIILTGGESLLNGLVDMFEKELKVPVFIAEHPLTCVAEGAGIMLNNKFLLD